MSGSVRASTVSRSSGGGPVDAPPPASSASSSSDALQPLVRHRPGGASRARSRRGPRAPRLTGCQIAGAGSAVVQRPGRRRRLPAQVVLVDAGAVAERGRGERRSARAASSGPRARRRRRQTTISAVPSTPARAARRGRRRRRRRPRRRRSAATCPPIPCCGRARAPPSSGPRGRWPGSAARRARCRGAWSGEIATRAFAPPWSPPAHRRGSAGSSVRCTPVVDGDACARSPDAPRGRRARSAGPSPGASIRSVSGAPISASSPPWRSPPAVPAVGLDAQRRRRSAGSGRPPASRARHGARAARAEPLIADTLLMRTPDCPRLHPSEVIRREPSGAHRTLVGLVRWVRPRPRRPGGGWSSASAAARGGA